MPRELTKEQFADGTTIDGDRIDRAMQESVDRFNSIPKGDLKNRFLRNTYALGWQPRVLASLGTDLPWMPETNSASYLATGAVAPTRYENYLRVKGNRAPGTLPGGTETSLVCTVPIAFPAPVILDDLAFMMTTDHTLAGIREYTNTFVYGAAPPPGFTAGDSVEDVSIVVQVDSPLLPENQALSSVAFAYHRVQLLREVYWTVDPGAAPASDMTLVYPGGTVSGVYLRARNMAIRIPARARVRFHFVIPEYSVATTAGWGTDTVTAQMFDMNICTLEEVV